MNITSLPNKNRRQLGGALVAVVASATMAAGATAAEDSLYRTGGQTVLQPAAQSDATGDAGQNHAATVRQSFGTAYATAGKPRLAVFSERSPGALPEIAEFQFKAGYSRPFLDAGVNFIDRNAIVNLTRAQMVDDERRLDSGDMRGHEQVQVQALKARAELFANAIDDAQLIETKALKGHADLVIRIGVTPSAESDIGVAFRVRAVDVKTGAVRADFLHEMATPKREQWAAVNGGYIRVTEDSEMNFEEAGRAVALQTMRELARVWRSL